VLLGRAMAPFYSPFGTPRPYAHDDFIAPKYAISQAIGFIKGKSTIHLARVDGEWEQNFAG